MQTHLKMFIKVIVITKMRVSPSYMPHSQFANKKTRLLANNNILNALKRELEKPWQSP